jgi:hypothetical protein
VRHSGWAISFTGALWVGCLLMGILKGQIWKVFLAFCRLIVHNGIINKHFGGYTVEDANSLKKGKSHSGRRKIR